LRKALFAFIAEAMQFFVRPENESLIDTNQFLRCNVCVIIRATAQDLGGDDALIDRVRGVLQDILPDLFSRDSGERCSGSL
jgi:hypothetical protein